MTPSTSEKRKKARSTHIPVKRLARQAVDAILEKKGKDILVLDISTVSGVSDFFILVTGDSDLHIRAIVDNVRQTIKDELREIPWHTEGTEHYHWVLMDYVDLVIHVFNRERRSYYELDRLWGDAPREEVADDASSGDVLLLSTND